jgi:hypothetical protein
MSELQEMPDSFRPEIHTRASRKDPEVLLRILYFRETEIECVDGNVAHMEVGTGYKLKCHESEDAERDHSLRLSVWKARELIRTCQPDRLSECNFTQFECSEEEECL